MYGKNVAKIWKNYLPAGQRCRSMFIVLQKFLGIVHFDPMKTGQWAIPTRGSTFPSGNKLYHIIADPFIGFTAKPISQKLTDPPYSTSLMNDIQLAIQLPSDGCAFVVELKMYL